MNPQREQEILQRLSDSFDTDLDFYDYQNAFYQDLRAAGVWIGTNRINFLSAAHAQTDLDKACEAYKACLNDFHQKAMI